MENKIIDNLNKVGNKELGERIRNMTIEEKCIVAENLEYDILLDALHAKLARYEELERGIADIVARMGK